ncbi:MAG TPA: type II toxin-antitoxin system RelE/ParE family toxin [Kofleriaceae bacterium]|nr:type II toxin-antitoxin system RelE/ParE family toxin [Kofleriaceae bacterium]
MAAAPPERRVRLLRAALAELELAADEYDAASPGLGDRYIATINQAFEVIRGAPERWPRVDDRHRRFLTPRFPYSAFYRFDDVEVIVVAVAHRRRRPGYWAAR